MTLTPNTTLQGGKYRILSMLGQGGFGITYLALHTQLDVKVAIKEFFMKDFCERGSDSHVSLGSSGSREMVERFRAKFIKEAQNIARLRHANIVRVTDVFEDNGTAYYVMEYHDGGSLADLVKSNGHLSEAKAVGYARQIADALDYLHARKINHLDVKPANVLLNDAGEAVLIDFGLAKHYDSEGNQTSTTPVGISHGYAPMEQYRRGGVGTFSPTSDIYSLGATLYKMLTGVTPPEASDLLNEGLPPMTVVVSPAVRNAVEQAMSPLIKDRPQSIGEFLALLNDEKPVAGVVVDDEKTNVVIEEKTTIEPEVEPEVEPESTKTVEDTTVPPTPEPTPESTPESTPEPTPESTPEPAEKPKSRKWLIMVCALLVAVCAFVVWRKSAYEVGDIITINGVKAMVYKVDNSGQHGMAMSLDEKCLYWNDAHNWCSNLGSGWRLPSKSELLEIYRNIEQLNKVLSQSGYERLAGWYWSSEESVSDSYRAWIVNMNGGHTSHLNKDTNVIVRAVSAF